MTTSETSIRNGEFHVRVWSSGTGAPVVYLHGFDGLPGEADYLERLAGSFQVFAPEHPGWGDSTGIDSIDDVLDMVLYYRQFIESLGVGKVSLVGHSLGGMFAAEIAAICPQVVDKLVLVAPFGLWLDDLQVPDLFTMSPGQLQRSTWHDPESTVAQKTLSQLGNGKTGNAAIITRAMNLSAAGKFLWPIPDRGLRKRLPLISAPTLVVVGASDKLIPPRYGDEFRSLIPGAKSVTVANAGHLPMAEQPDDFFAAVEPFLKA